jgi:hypothetical protein
MVVSFMAAHSTGTATDGYIRTKGVERNPLQVFERIGLSQRR